MGTTEDHYQQFLREYESWLRARRPLENLRNPLALTHAFEVDLDHEVGYISSLARDAEEKSTKIDYEEVASRELADLEVLLSTLNTLSLPEADKRKYVDFISVCRSLVERIKALPVPPEGHLGFRKSVLEAFRFLEEDYGFRVVETSPIRVRYQSSQVYVELCFEPVYPEMTLTLGRLAKSEGSNEETFYLDDVLYVGSAERSLDFKTLNLETREGVESLVRQAARLFQQHAAGLLRNDPAEFKLLEDMAQERDRQHTERMNRQANLE